MNPNHHYSRYTPSVDRSNFPIDPALESSQTAAPTISTGVAFSAAPGTGVVPDLLPPSTPVVAANATLRAELPKKEVEIGSR
ncbi:hypothetical protein FRC11_006538, partial [Ceratobasidium sp. 423]